MARFGLIHGGGMGSWCWERLLPDLERRGHAAVVVDLPTDDDRAGLSDYAELATQKFEGYRDLIVVGHSLGGLVVPLVAERVPARRMVFICGMVPEPGSSAEQQLAADPEMVAPEIAPQGGDQRIEPAAVEQAIALLYQDCTDSDTQWALSRMRRQSDVPWRQKSPLSDWPEVPSTYILGREDRCVSPEWGRRVAIGRLGSPAVELSTGHSPFIAAPAQLADALDALALAGP